MVAEIKAENAAKCEMSKEQYRAYLIAAMKTSAGQIGPDHRFCQIYKVVDENGVTREFRMPDKLRAAQLLAQHCGWDEPTKVALDISDSLSAFLRDVVLSSRRYATSNGSGLSLSGSKIPFSAFQISIRSEPARGK